MTKDIERLLESALGSHFRLLQSKRERLEQVSSQANEELRKRGLGRLVKFDRFGTPYDPMKGKARTIAEIRKEMAELGLDPHRPEYGRSKKEREAAIRRRRLELEGK